MGNKKDEVKTISLDTLKSLGKKLTGSGYGIVKGKGIFAVTDLTAGTLGRKKLSRGGSVKLNKKK
tara:strand:- start:5 stop:199 length:195 start_codon:yes stop_codon:yes gene_type:complete